MRPLALAGASGGLAGWALQVLSQAALEPSPLEIVQEACNCGLDHKFRFGGFEIDLLSVLLGVLIGLTLGPVIDCLYLIRQLWTAYLRSQFNSLRPSRTYRILA